MYTLLLTYGGWKDHWSMMSGAHIMYTLTVEVDTFTRSHIYSKVNNNAKDRLLYHHFCTFEHLIQLWGLLDRKQNLTHKHPSQSTILTYEDNLACFPR